MTTLTDLGWSATDEKTDPPIRDTEVETWVNRGSNVFKLKGTNDGEVIQMEDAAEVKP